MNKKTTKNSFPMAVFVILVACVVIFWAAQIFSKWMQKSQVNEKKTETPASIVACSPEIKEVCGTDGNTYRNACLAEKSNVQYTAGKCAENSENLAKNEEKNSANSEIKACTREYDPVCGSDGNTYANSCLAENAKTKIVSFGECQKKEEKNSEKITTETLEKTTENSENLAKNEEKNSANSEKNENATTLFANTTVNGANAQTPLPSENSSTEENSNTENQTENTSKLSAYDSAKFHHYKNTSVGYSFAIPKNASYQGFWPQNGASHTLAIQNSGAIENFENASVKVYYYNAAPANPPANSTSVTLANGAVVYVASDNSAGTANIVNTILSSIEKN